MMTMNDMKKYLITVEVDDRQNVDSGDEGQCNVSPLFLAVDHGEHVLVVIYSHRTRTYHYFDLNKRRRETLASDIKRELEGEEEACVVVIEGEYFCLPCDSWRRLINALNDDDE